MMSASLIASTACTVARPGCPGPTPTSLTVLPGPTRKRLELSRYHVVGQRRQRLHRLATTDAHELASRIGRQRLRSFDCTPRSSALAHESDDLLRFRDTQCMF